MIRRLAQLNLLKRLKTAPAAALVGPRQSGKTTLAKSLGKAYYDLEQEPDRLRLDIEWDGLLKSKQLIILDEAQSWPEIFARLRGAIDSDRKRMGRFLLLGSVSPSLMTHVSESLAGRLALVEMTPFLFKELGPKTTVDKHWLFGGYPDGGILNAKHYPLWHSDYMALLTQRDLPNWGLPAKPLVIQRLLRMSAALHSQLWNASGVGKGLGLSYQTVNSYLDYLEGSFLIRRLPPYLVNLKKRLVKSPKVYWRDSGLLHALLNVPSRDALLNQPWVGASWEGYVLEQAISTLKALEVPFDPYFFRTSDGHEIDLVLDFGTERWALEVKLTSSPSSEDFTRLNKTADLISSTRRILVSQVGRSVSQGNLTSCNLPYLVDHLKRLVG